MKGLVVIAIMLTSLTVRAESQERKPANRIDLGAALNSALSENERMRESFEAGVTVEVDENEQGKIYVELGDGK